MALRHVCAVIAGLIIVESASLSGKALFCRDPDTGKLHAINSTWASSTFCGNYTCKLRKLNVTETEYTPIRQINITDVLHNETNEKIIHKNDTMEEIVYTVDNAVLETDKENITVTIEARTEPEIETIIHKDKTYNDTGLMNEISEIKDEYLTEKEINSISDVLHTVKKSDLDAIVEIYNLAQDIYNEMDKATNEGIVDDTINTIVNEKFKNINKKSYWYDPLIYKNSDMDYEGSNPVPKRELPTYFNEAQDVISIPHYNPISKFHRSSPYIHPSIPIIPERKPCKTKEHSLEKLVKETQNLIKPSYLLPYPFAYINHYYNYSHYPPQYYNNPYWNTYRHQYQPYFNAYITQIPNAELINPNLRKERADLEQKSVENDLLGKVLVKTKENLLPDWKTEQLSHQILDDVRAKIDTSKLLKAFPFRKRVKLEKVGKLVKLDELTRRRRSPDTEEVKVDVKQEEGDYETFLEKTTCQTKVIPGYFRYGNLTQPYPECCPQMIIKNNS